MQTAFIAWHRKNKRQRHRLQPFASIPLGKAAGLFGGKPTVNPETAAKNAEKASKEHEKESSGKADKDEPKPKKPETITELLKEQQEILAEERPDKPLAARIVAYSDSEGEDEPFQLARRRKKKKEEEEQAEAADETPEHNSASTHRAVPVPETRHGPKIFRTARICTRRAAGKVGDDAGWGLILQFILLWFFRSRKRKWAQRFELLTLAISVPDALGVIAGTRGPSSRLPSTLRKVFSFTESWARPSAIFQLEELVRRVLPKKKRRRFLTTISQSVRVFEEANLGGKTLEDYYDRPRPPPRLAAESAALFKVELTEMKRILDSQGVKLPAERFDDTNAELMRFAASAGLMEAVSPEEKAHAIQEGAQRILKTLDWLKKYKFMPPAQLKEWQHMVRWQGSDTEGWPILVIKMAKACAQCQGNDADSVASAVVSQVQRGVAEIFSNQHGPDKLVVVMDASNANSLQAARNVSIFKQVAVLLDKHYPNRLQQLFIVELPPQLRWVLATLKPILQPQTKEKIRTISMSDPALPLPENVLLSPRFEGKEEESDKSSTTDYPDSHRSRRVSIPELPVSSSPPGPPPASRQSSTQTDLPVDPVEEEKPRRRARIMELPFRESGPKATPPRYMMQSNGGNSSQYSPGSILRPALKRSASVGLIGMKSSSEGLSDMDELSSDIEA